MDSYITLLNGTNLECLPKVKSDRRTRWPYQTAEEKEETEVFLNNAFFLLAQRERIMNDSRMFLAEVPIKNGLDWTGSFHYSCLGAYLEWWTICPYAVKYNSNPVSLIIKISGNPISCSNNCEEVLEDGSRHACMLCDFMASVGKFCYILGRYMKAMNTCQVYSIKEVVEKLHIEGKEKNKT